MNPEKPSERLPDDASPEVRKLAAEADETLQRMEEEVQQIESDVEKIERIEKEMRSDSSQ
jgi:hypothetical protein